MKPTLKSQYTLVLLPTTDGVCATLGHGNDIYLEFIGTDYEKFKPYINQSFTAKSVGKNEIVFSVGGHTLKFKRDGW